MTRPLPAGRPIATTVKLSLAEERLLADLAFRENLTLSAVLREALHTYGAQRGLWTDAQESPHAQA